MDDTYTAVGDIRVLSYHEPAGPLGFLPMHAYLVKAREPILVETGIYTQGPGFLAALRDELDPADLRWIMITHEDLDHAGNLEAMMTAAPNARLVLSFLAMLKISRMDLTTPDRIVIATPGEWLDAGGRRFGMVRPPIFDSSATVAYFDEKTRALFSADCFGGLVPAPTSDVDPLGDAYDAGSAIFMSANTAWLHGADQAKFKRAVDAVRTIGPDVVLPTHGAPLKGRTDRLCDQLMGLPATEPFAFPNDAAFREMLAQMKAQEGAQRPSA
jgi:flavorubredoxin